MQHRGQESAGIAIHNGGRIKCHKELGLLPNVFDEFTLNNLLGDIGIGHVRYSATEQNCKENAQPIATQNILGNIAVAHNGNIVNSNEIRMNLERKGFIFQTTADSEVIVALLSKEIAKAENIEDALTEVMKTIKGAYALTIMTKDKLIAVRDPMGMRPLVLGKLNDSYVVASETCAFDCVRSRIY